MTPSLKYARWERERRFLLAGAPDAAEGARVLHIEDHYVQSTRLRLRRVLQDGHDPIYKLGQKIRLDPGDPSTVAHTTLYLDRTEYDACATFPGSRRPRRAHSASGTASRSLWTCSPASSRAWCSQK